MVRRRVVGVLVLLLGCTGHQTRTLDELDIVDSTYVDPATGAPYTGRVVARFPEAQGGGTQLEARLADGAWEGEFTLFHSTGRIRYQGEMADGAPCGGWVENEDPVVPGSLLDEVTQELESLVIYSECPE